jgi:hypothetical protein
MVKPIIILDGLANPPGSTAVGVIQNVTTASRVEALNGENTLDFTAILDAKMRDLLDEDSVLCIGGYYGDYFDVMHIKKNVNEDGTYTVDVEADHVSYRLNDPDYNMDVFSRTGTPTYVLGELLAGTGFSAGTVEFTTELMYEIKEKKSRRQMLMELVGVLGAELSFYNFSINLLVHRGSTDEKPVLKDRDVTVLSQTIDKRTLDDDGNPTVSYECSPTNSSPYNYELGDDVSLLHARLDIDESLRVVSKKYNPYSDSEIQFVFGTFIKDVAQTIYDQASAGVGGGNNNSTTLQITIESSGLFHSVPWAHGFDTDKDIIQLLTTPQYYDDTVVKLADICIERLSTTTVRIVGRAEVL